MKTTFTLFAVLCAFAMDCCADDTLLQKRTQNQQPTEAPPSIGKQKVRREYEYWAETFQLLAEKQKFDVAEKAAPLILSKYQGTSERDRLYRAKVLHIWAEVALATEKPELAVKIAKEIHRTVKVGVSDCDQAYYDNLAECVELLAKSEPQQLTKRNRLKQKAADLRNELPVRLAAKEEELALTLDLFGQENAATAIIEITIGRMLQGETHGPVGLGEEAAAKSLARFESAAQTFERVCGQSQFLAYVWSDIGGVYQGTGNQRAAEKKYRDALRLLAATIGTNCRDYASAQNNLGLLLLGKRDFLPAESLFRSALDVFQRSLPSLHPNTATAHNNLAMSLHHQMLLQDARFHYEECVKLRSMVLPKNHPLLLQALNNLSVLESYEGDEERALDQLESTLLVLRKDQNADPLLAARVTHNIGISFAGSNKLDKAQTHLREASATRTRILGKTHPLTVLSREQAANVSLRMKRFDEAFESFHACIVDAESWLLQNFSLLSEPDQIREQRVLYRLLSSTLSAAMKLEGDQSQNAFERVYPHVARFKAMLSLNQIFATQLANNAKASHLIQQYVATMQEIRASQWKEPEAEESDISALYGKLGDISSEMMHFFPEFESVARIDNASTAIPLSRDRALIDYMEFERRTVDIGQRIVSTPHVVGFVVQSRESGVEVHAVDCGSARSIEKKIDSWMSTLGSMKPFDKNASDIRSTIWDPAIASVESRTKHVVVSPDGPLLRIPFNALPNAEGTYLIQDYLITCSPSFARKAGASQTYSVDDLLSEVLVAADISFDHEKNSGPNLRALDGEGEAKLIETISELAHNNNLDVLRRTEATPDAILSALQSCSYAHISTHGFTDLLDASALDPFSQFRSGFFAARSGDDGGSQVSDLQLLGVQNDNLEVVVVAACETGMGIKVDGSGVFGIPRALHIAGARCVIAPAWNVDEAATRELMLIFYRLLRDVDLEDDAGVARVFRKAQLELMVAANADKDVNDINTLGKGKSSPIGDLKEVKPSPNVPVDPYWWCGFRISGLR